MATVTAAGRRQEPSAGRPASAPGARVLAARVTARPCTPRAQDTHRVRWVVPPGQHRGGFRGVVPPGRHRGGFRGVVPQGQHRRVLGLATAPSGVPGREGRCGGQARPVG